MMTDERDRDVLSKDLMELQIGQIDLLIAMYESDSAISLDATSSDLLDTLRDWCESNRETAPQLTSTCINLVLNLEVAHDSGGLAKSLQLTLSFPLTAEANASEPPAARIRLQQPDWMSKSEASRLTAELPNEDVLTVIEHAKEVAREYLAQSTQAEALASPSKEETSMVRVWFYFPSISTREKRDDLVNYAPAYGLTGFLLSGKPGILCLEGGPVAIDEFMNFIKTDSWRDIPPQHKKVSERYREDADGLKRAFNGMQEITDMLGERRGERANRNDMKALKAWLEKSGLGEAFERVLM